MNVLLICSYKGKYLDIVLKRLIEQEAPKKFHIMVWDNGGAEEVCERYGVFCGGAYHRETQQAVNIGKSFGFHNLRNIKKDIFDEANCYVCMDDDIIVDARHLDALVQAALMPGLGMIAPYYHPFNSPMPDGWTSVLMDSCPTAGEGTELRLKIFDPTFRTEQKRGMIGGGLFAVSRANVAKLPWAPDIYDVINKNGQAVVYYSEDATLDDALTKLGLINGYLDNHGLTPVIHLPELNREYQAWKVNVQTSAGLPTSNPF